MRPRPRCELLLEQLGGAAEHGELAVREVVQFGGDNADSSCPRPLEEPATGRGRLDLDRPAVAPVRSPADETVPLEAVDDPGHRRGADALRGRELAEGERSTEDDHRERGEPRSADTGPAVLLGRAPKQVNGRRVQAVSDFFGLALRHISR